MCLIACMSTPTTKKAPWQRGSPRCSTRARPGWASISIHRDLSSCILARAFWKCSLQRKLPCTGRQAKSGSQRSPKDFEVVLAVWRNPCTGAFCASEREPRTSCDIYQWTDRYSIALGSSRAPSASLNLLHAVSFRSSPRLSSHCGRDPHGQCRKRSMMFHLLESR